ncbi:putative redox-sensing transcriptional repressor Rex [Peptostreptococcaceae bacterium oral taxon 113 str. W5053]|nr:putative redox-sensing transcriptional repressor Rex [Peptostreptococcaceae bacterium oral taxon 113 str. W5053]
MKKMKVSIAVIKRLPKYYRYLGMIEEKGIIRISSQELSSITGLTASQIRQDLNHFGGFGQQGYGYNVKELKNEIEKIIGIKEEYSAILIGAGNLGHAIVNYEGFKNNGFNIVAVFDTKNELIGKKLAGVPVYSIDKLEAFIEKNNVTIGVLTLPKNFAQQIADRLVHAGVKGLWNFAPIDLVLPDEIVLEDVHLDESLYTLTYYLNNPGDYPGNH